MTSPTVAPTITHPAPRSRNLFIVADNIEEYGGVQRVAHVLADEFSRRGHNVELIGISHKSRAQRLRRDGAGYREHVIYDELPEAPAVRQRSARGLNPKRRARAWRQRRVFGRGVRRLRALLDGVDDGLIICMQVAAMEWVAAAKPSHLRVIGQSHESFEASAGLTPATYGSTRYTRILTFYSDVDSLLLLTATDAKKFVASGLNNTGVMPNPVADYPDQPSRLTTPTVISVGRYVEQKNQQALINAFALIAPEHPDWQLKIFGEGPLRGKLQQQIDDLGLTAVAHLMGPTDTVTDELLDSSIFALSSDFEGLPLVLVEAMACGVPCVAFDCSPGIRDIIDNDVDGLVVPNRDEPQLAAAIARLIDDEQLRQTMGHRSRDNIQRFGMDQVMQRWERLFDLVEL